MKILIVKLSSLGDVIHVLPVLAPLRQHFSDVRITWLVEEDAAQLLTDHPLIDRVLVVPKKRWLNDLSRASRLITCFGEVGRFIRELRSERYDLVLDFQGLLKSGVLACLARSERKRGFYPGREWSHVFLNERVPYPAVTLHSVDRYLALIESLGCSCRIPQWTIPIRQVHRDRVAVFLEANGITRHRPLILLHPGTRWKSKNWPELSWAELGVLLNQENCQLVLTGSNGDRALVQSIKAARTFAAVDASGLWSLAELAFLQSQADVVVTPDSGPMHLAAAVGTPVVALFGPTDPDRTGPYGTAGHRVLVKPVACRPCFKRTCATCECLTALTPEEVCGAVRDVLSEAKEQ